MFVKDEKRIKHKRRNRERARERKRERNTHEQRQHNSTKMAPTRNNPKHAPQYTTRHIAQSHTHTAAQTDRERE